MVEISVPRGTYHRRRGVVTHQSTDFDRVDTVQVDGIPTPQVELYDDGRFVMRLDFGYPEARVGIELDSVAHHLNGLSFEGDKVKRNHARRMGWLIIEVTHRMLVDAPATVIAELAEALRARGALL